MGRLESADRSVRGWWSYQTPVENIMHSTYDPSGSCQERATCVCGLLQARQTVLRWYWGSENERQVAHQPSASGQPARDRHVTGTCQLGVRPKKIGAHLLTQFRG